MATQTVIQEAHGFVALVPDVPVNIDPVVLPGGCQVRGSVPFIDDVVVAAVGSVKALLAGSPWVGGSRDAKELFLVVLLYMFASDHR